MSGSSGSTYVSGVDYEPSGAYTALHLGNGMVSRYWYNNRLQPTTIRLGGESQVRFETELGPRVVDQFINGAAHEAKVGYQALTTSAGGTAEQIAKDVELMQSGQANTVTWHFYTSATTGKIGPSQPLLRELESKAIRVEYHP